MKRLVFFSLLFVAVFFASEARATSYVYDNSSCGLGADFANQRVRSVTFTPTTSFVLTDVDFSVYGNGDNFTDGARLFEVAVYKGGTSTDPLSSTFTLDKYQSWQDVYKGEANSTWITFSSFEDVYLYEGDTYTITIDDIYATENYPDNENYVSLNGDSTGCTGYEDTIAGSLYWNDSNLSWQSYTDPDDWRIAIRMQGTQWGVTEFGLLSTLWVSDSGDNIYDLSCSTTGVEVCASETLMNSLLLFGTSTSILVDEHTYTIDIQDSNGKTLPPEAYYKNAIEYTEAGTNYLTSAFTISDTGSSTMKIVSCVSATDKTETTEEYCTTIWYGNGRNLAEFEQSLIYAGLLDTEDDKLTIWEKLKCNDIGITDVKKGVQCALVWALEPSDTVTQKWAQVKSHMLSIWPIGYGTIMLSDFTTAVTSTSTEYFDNDINVGRWFGRPDAENATVTISVAHSVSEMGKFEVFVNYAEKIMWILFAIWVFGFAVTRKL